MSTEKRKKANTTDSAGIQPVGAAIHSNSYALFIFSFNFINKYLGSCNKTAFCTGCFPASTLDSHYYVATLFKTFGIAGTPRAEVFWFELILKLEKDDNNWGFQVKDCWKHVPRIELAVCYDRLGEYEKAVLFNEMTRWYKPGSPEVLHNKKYFESRLVNH